MSLLLALLLFAQAPEPPGPQTAYITADPVDPDRLGLATQTGRFSVTSLDCDWLADGQNVLIYPDYALPPLLAITTPEGEGGCMVRIEARMSDTPCFLNDAGDCDVATENE